MPAWFNDVTKIMKRNEFNKCIGEVTVKTVEGYFFAGTGNNKNLLIPALTSLSICCNIESSVSAFTPRKVAMGVCWFMPSSKNKG